MIYLYALLFKLLSRALLGRESVLPPAEVRAAARDGTGEGSTHEMQRHDQSGPPV